MQRPRQVPDPTRPRAGSAARSRCGAVRRQSTPHEFTIVRLSASRRERTARIGCSSVGHIYPPMLARTHICAVSRPVPEQAVLVTSDTAMRASRLSIGFPWPYLQTIWSSWALRMRDAGSNARSEPVLTRRPLPGMKRTCDDRHCSSVLGRFLTVGSLFRAAPNSRAVCPERCHR